MGMYFVLAWRNIWRNKHRTLITTASVFFAVILVLFMRSMQLGSYRHIIRNTVSLSTGFIQIHADGFWDKRSLENSMELRESIIQNINSINHVTRVIPRIETFALVSSGNSSRGAGILGINPDLEDKMNNLSARITEGQYFTAGESGILVPERLARYLDVSVGDSLVLLGQGYHGYSAAGLYPVKGLLSLPVPDLNAGFLFITLEEAQYFLSMPGRITTLAVMIDKPDNLHTVESDIKETLSSDRYEVMTWRQMLPELVQSIEIDNAGGLIMLGILYLIIGFGIFGTVMMMAAERMREFAILISVGMKKWRLGLILLLETVMIGMSGAIAGALISIPVLLYMKSHPIYLSGDIAEVMIQFGYEPIIPFIAEPSIFINHAVTVFIISLVSCIIPFYTLYNIRISDTLRA